jgi:hypothetical protein
LQMGKSGIFSTLLNGAFFLIVAFILFILVASVF